jgi:hypothetical protein
MLKRFNNNIKQDSNSQKSQEHPKHHKLQRN